MVSVQPKPVKIIADIVVGGHLHLLVFPGIRGVKELSQMQAVDGKTVHLPQEMVQGLIQTPSTSSLPFI